MGNQRQTLRNKRKIGVSNYQNKVIDTKTVHTQISKSISRELKLTIISIFIVTIVMLSSAFAIFSSVQKSESYNTLTVGTLKVDFIDKEDGMGNVINLNGAYPESDTKGLAETPYSFKITNSGTLDANYEIKILDDTDMIAEDQCGDNLLDKSKIRVSINNETPFTLSDKETDGYVMDAGTLKSGKSATYEVRIWLDENGGNEVLGKHYHGKIVVEGVNVDGSTNSNIVSAYTYNASTCVTGEEATCVETTCYEDESVNSCEAGTIIKYKVNNTEEKYFHVLHDDGDTMTLQQRENTVYNTSWYADSNDNTKGPLTILPVLESATAGWTNVNDQTYTMGTTIFKDNVFTGCDGYNSCTANTYTLAARTAKSRMVTVQEATSVGCTGSNNSCPNFMNNYLNTSTSNGGTVNDSTGSANYGYWTMSASSSYPGSGAHSVSYHGCENSNFTTDTGNGARAVVVVNK